MDLIDSKLKYIHGFDRFKVEIYPWI